jgi:thiamine-monophosphate kinase
LKADGAAYGLPLLGGDTVATPGPLTLSVTAFGLVPKGRMLRRAGARAGDTLFVTGTIGDGVLGLAALRQRLTLSPEDAAFLSRRYRRPEPRTALGPLLLEHGLASACLDLSDGLAADAGHLASASRVRLTIEAHRVPLSAPALHQIDLGAMDLPELFTGGDDYELLFTAPPEAEATLRALAQETGTAIAAIGRAEAGEGVRVLDPGGAALDLPETGYTHFS